LLPPFKLHDSVPNAVRPLKQNEEEFIEVPIRSPRSSHYFPLQQTAGYTLSDHSRNGRNFV